MGTGRRKVWDAAGGRERLTLKGHVRRSTSVSWSPDGTRLATGSRDGTAKVWDAAGGRALVTLGGHTGMVDSVSWSPDGTRLATGSRDGTAKVWDAAGGRELLALEGHTGGSSVSWSPNGSRLATGSQDGMAKVWDAAGGRERLTLKGHTGRSFPCAWSPDGRRLATGSEDGTAKVWDAAGGRERLTLTGHRAGSVPCPGRRTGRGWRRGVWMGRRRYGTRPAAASRSPSRAMRGGSVRVLVAGREAAGDRECGWDGEGMGRGRRPANCSPSRGIRARSVPCPGRRTGRGWRPGVMTARRRSGTPPKAGNCSPQGAYRPGLFVVLVARREAAGHGEWGRDGARSGTPPNGREPLALGGMRAGLWRVLVAGRESAGQRELGWDGEGLGGGRRPGAAHPRGLRARSLPRPGRRTGRGWQREWGQDDEGVGGGRRRELLTLKGIRDGSVPSAWSLGRDSAGDGECGRDGEGLGRGRGPRTPHTPGACEPGQGGILVAGWNAAGHRGVRMAGQRCGRRPRPMRCGNGPARIAVQDLLARDNFRGPKRRDSSRPGSCSFPSPGSGGERRPGPGPVPDRGGGGPAAQCRATGRDRRSGVGLAGASVAGGGRGLQSVAGRVSERSVAYAACYIESDRRATACGSRWAAMTRPRSILTAEVIYLNRQTRDVVAGHGRSGGPEAGSQRTAVQGGE